MLKPMLDLPLWLRRTGQEPCPRAGLRRAHLFFPPARPLRVQSERVDQKTQRAVSVQDALRHAYTITAHRHRRLAVDTQNSIDILQVALGAHRYAVVHPWNRVQLGHVSQLALDSAGRVYAFQRTGSPIAVLTSDGELATSWGLGQISDPHGIFITADDRVLLVDRDAHQIMIFDTHGQLQAIIGDRHHPRFGLPFNHPTDVAVAPSGEIYLCDGYGNSHVHC